MRAIVLILFTLSLPVAAAAQVQIEKRRPAKPNGEVSIENSFGAVTVKAWDQNEVLVRGELAAGAEELDFSGDSDGTYIDVEVPDAWFYASDDDSDYRTTLEVFVPSGSHLDIETVNATVDVAGVKGEIEVETVNGSIRLEGATAAVDVETMTGQIEVWSAGAPMSVDSISGAVTLHGARNEVHVESVSGPVTVQGSEVRSLGVESISGDVSFEGSLASGKGRVEIETFSGVVTLVLPAKVQARFELSTFSGQIHSALGPQTPSGDRFTPYKKLRFSTGLREYDVSVDTHNADINLRLNGQ